VLTVYNFHLTPWRWPYRFKHAFRCPWD